MKTISRSVRFLETSLPNLFLFCCVLRQLRHLLEKYPGPVLFCLRESARRTCLPPLDCFDSLVFSRPNDCSKSNRTVTSRKDKPHPFPRPKTSQSRHLPRLFRTAQFFAAAAATATQAEYLHRRTPKPRAAEPLSRLEARRRRTTVSSSPLPLVLGPHSTFKVVEPVP